MSCRTVLSCLVLVALVAPGLAPDAVPAARAEGAIAVAPELPRLLVGHIEAKLKRKRALPDREVYETLLADACARAAKGRYVLVAIELLEPRPKHRKKAGRRGCRNARCLARLARKASIRYVLHPHLLEKGRKHFFQLELIDVRTASELSKSLLHRFSWSEGAFELILERAVQEVFAGRLGPGVDAANGAPAPAPPPAAAGEAKTGARVAKVAAEPAIPSDVNLDAGDMVWIPPGRFYTGCPAGRIRCPRNVAGLHQEHVDGFWIDRHEVTVRDYARCVQAGRCTPPESGVRERWNWGQEGRERHPVNAVTFEQAERFCRWAGKRLPYELEWEKAARGTDGRPYPWGRFAPECRVAVMAGCGKSGTRSVCRKAPGKSPYGLCDMAGNVWEWVAGGGSRGNPVIRGGSYTNGAQELRTWTRQPFRGWKKDSRIGFRCAAAYSAVDAEANRVRGVAPDAPLQWAPPPTEVATHHYQACNAGQVKSCYELGRLLAAGRGGFHAMPRRAVQVFELACARDHAAACAEGAALAAGDDPERARKLYRKSCDGGHARACFELALMHSEAKGGLEDHVRARTLHARACDQKLADACFKLGWLWHRGKGGAADPARAAEYYGRACTLGNAHGCELSRLLAPAP